MAFIKPKIYFAHKCFGCHRNDATRRRTRASTEILLCLTAHHDCNFH